MVLKQRTPKRCGVRSVRMLATMRCALPIPVGVTSVAPPWGMPGRSTK